MCKVLLCIVFNTALKFSWHVPVQWVREKGQTSFGHWLQEGHGGKQCGYYLSEIGGLAKANVEFSSLAILSLEFLFITLA